MSGLKIGKEENPGIKISKVDPDMKSITTETVSPLSSIVDDPLTDSSVPQATKVPEVIKVVNPPPPPPPTESKAKSSALDEMAKEIVIDAKTEMKAIEKVTRKSKSEFVTMKMAYAPDAKTSKWEPSKCYGVAFERHPGEVKVSAFECPTTNRKCPLKPSHDKCNFMPLRSVKADIAF